MLLAMHQTLVERGLCFREHTERGRVLIFPSYLPPGTTGIGQGIRQSS